jgi:flagellar biosynthesis protein
MTDSIQPFVRRQAVALAQESDGEARVLAKGYGELAEQIINAARVEGIPVHDSPELVGLLLQVDMDQRIPPELYRAVAEILVWLEEVAEEAERRSASNTR